MAIVHFSDLGHNQEVRDLTNFQYGLIKLG